MFNCRLFHTDDPATELQSRIVTDGVTAVGRGQSSDWRLDAADVSLSRVHCELEVADGGLFVRDLSTNGTFLAGGSRLPRDERCAVAPGETLRIGPWLIRIERAAVTQLLPAADPALAAAAPPPRPEPPPEQALSPEPAAAERREASLMEAFCEGARIDASCLSAEDPAEVMRKAGAIYQQAVAGLAMLMAERARQKADYDPNRTTISFERNNPFKWAPARKLTEDLLRTGDQAFLCDAEAVEASFRDLFQHMAALANERTEALDEALIALAPAVIEAQVSSSLLRSHAAACWDIYKDRYAALTAADPEGPAALAG